MENRPRKTVPRGEILYGHRGQYRTLHYGNASEAVLKEMLSVVDAGRWDSDKNIIVCIGTKNTRDYLWKSFITTGEGGDYHKAYQNVIYQEISMKNLRDAGDLIRLPFTKDAEKDYFLDHPAQFTQENRTEHEPQVSNDEVLSRISVSEEKKEALACYIAAKNRSGSRNYLVIQVPAEVKDYQGWCMEAIVCLISLIPAGLRRELSFATNASSRNGKQFGILFQRDEGAVVPCGVRLDRETESFLRDYYLPEELEQLVRLCVRDPEIRNRCFEDMEQVSDLAGETVTEADYIDYEKYLGLAAEPENFTMLCHVERAIAERMPAWKKRLMTSLIGDRIGSLSKIEKLMQDSEEFRATGSIRDILLLFSRIIELNNVFFRGGQHYSSDFLNVCLRHVLPEINEAGLTRLLKELSQYKQHMEAYFDPQEFRRRVDEMSQLRDHMMQKRLTEKALAGMDRDTIKEVLDEAGNAGESVMHAVSRSITEELGNQVREGNLSPRRIGDLYEVFGTRNCELAPVFIEEYVAYETNRQMQYIGQEPSEETIIKLAWLLRQYPPEKKLDYMAAAAGSLAEVFRRWNTADYSDDPEQYIALFRKITQVFGAAKQGFPEIMAPAAAAGGKAAANARNLTESADGCRMFCLLKYVNADFTIDRLKQVMDLSQQLTDPAQFFSVLDSIVLQYIKKHEGEMTYQEFKELFEVVGRDRNLSGPLQNWYEERIGREEDARRLQGMSTEIRTFYQLFQTWYEYRETMLKWHDNRQILYTGLSMNADPRELTFWNFYQAVRSSERKEYVYPHVKTSGTQKAFYYEVFSWFYREDHMYLDVSYNTDTDTLIDAGKLYTLFLRINEKNQGGICVYFSNGKRFLEKTEYEAANEAFLILEEICGGGTGRRLRYEEETIRCLELLLKYWPLLSEEARKIRDICRHYRERNG